MTNLNYSRIKYSDKKIKLEFLRVENLTPASGVFNGDIKGGPVNEKRHKE